MFSSKKKYDLNEHMIHGEDQLKYSKIGNSGIGVICAGVNSAAKSQTPHLTKLPQDGIIDISYKTDERNCGNEEIDINDILSGTCPRNSAVLLRGRRRRRAGRFDNCGRNHDSTG